MSTTKETKHTPGPWEAVGNAVHAENGREILFGQHNTRSADDDEKRANARLIAAAPDLLDALKNTADALEVFASIAPILHDDAAWQAAVNRARAAIARAEGE